MTFEHDVDAKLASDSENWSRAHSEWLVFGPRIGGQSDPGAQPPQ